jgi:uncharacterized ubiquitin-like protein YukD
MPKEATLLTEQIETANKAQVLQDDEHCIKSYQCSTIMPKESALLTEQIESANKAQVLQDDEHCLKSYECTNMLPLQKDLLELNKSLSEFDISYMKPEELAFLQKKGLSLDNQTKVTDAQKRLYDRQRIAFDDKKLQNIFDTQIRYSSMIFQDDPEPDVLEIGKDNAVSGVYNELIKEYTDNITPIKRFLDRDKDLIPDISDTEPDEFTMAADGYGGGTVDGVVDATEKQAWLHDHDANGNKIDDKIDPDKDKDITQ